MIVFDSDRGGDYRDLYVMDADGENLVRLTTGKAHNLAGPWSPDGTRIVYTAFGPVASAVWVTDAAPLEGGTGGTGQANLTDSSEVDEGFPAWSPAPLGGGTGGQRIAFTTDRDGNNEIYVMGAAPLEGGTGGANLIRLTDNPGDDFAPAWSPDGAQTAFVSDRDREAGIYDLYVMPAPGPQAQVNADSSGVTRLTDDEAIDYSPAWSPDGSASGTLQRKQKPGT